MTLEKGAASERDARLINKSRKEGEEEEEKKNLRVCVTLLNARGFLSLAHCSPKTTSGLALGGPEIRERRRRQRR